LDAGETQRLLEVVRGLRDSGVGIVLVSHFLEDVFAIADTITVLRDGRTIVDAAPREQLTASSAVDAMLGERREPAHPAARPARPASPTGGAAPGAAGANGGLTLRDVEVRGVLQPLSLQVPPGEVVALAGLEGSGTQAVLKVLYGDLGIDAGTVQLPSGRPAPRSIPAAVRDGVAFIPADRGRIGLFGDRSVRDNISVVRTLALSVDRLLLPTSAMNNRAKARVAQLDIRPGRTDIPVRALSGGNQQKVVFAKWLEATPSLYLLDDPTRGVDVHTRADMHRVIRDLADQGAVVVIVSSDLDELCSVADRAVVFFHGRAVGEVRAPDITAHRLLEAINDGALTAPSPQQ
jgi:ABC-type sugar transport system ATPase subunit